MRRRNPDLQFHKAMWQKHYVDYETAKNQRDRDAFFNRMVEERTCISVMVGKKEADKIILDIQKALPKLNPGAAWHHHRYSTAFERSYNTKLPLGSQQIAAGMAEEAMVSEKEAKRLGMPNPKRRNPKSAGTQLKVFGIPLIPLALGVAAIWWLLKHNK